MTHNRVGHPVPGGDPSHKGSQGRLRAHYRRVILWVLQAWLTMFYLAAGYAKLTEPIRLLSVLMTWPGLVDPIFVRILGALDVILACCFIAPLYSLASRPVPRWTLMIIMGASLGFLLFHASERNLALVLANGLLIAAAGTILRDQAGGEPS